MRLITIYTENVPSHDAATMVAIARRHRVWLLGPNSAGIASPGQANMSDIDSRILRRGSVGIVSKSGTLTYEVIAGLNQYDLGESTVVCLGGDAIVGTRFVDVVDLFLEDSETSVIVLLGEIGGVAEVEAARHWRDRGGAKPLVAYIAGRAAPPGHRMGHAGAITANLGESAAEKTREVEKVGAAIAPFLTGLPALIADGLTRSIDHEGRPEEIDKIRSEPKARKQNAEE
jgi:succinyl-CoA synthetase alpha subunit